MKNCLDNGGHYSTTLPVKVKKMNVDCIEKKLFEKIDYTHIPLARGEYISCTFKSCSFHDVNLSNIIFRECVFDNCDLSLSNLKNTTLNNVSFERCKLLGVQFNVCNKFWISVSFQECLLRLSSFSKLKLPKTKFAHCNLQEVDFSEADLAHSVFDNCDLGHAVFFHTNLEKADFRSAFNYSFDPELNKIKKAQFSLIGIAGLLDKYDIKIE